MAVFGGSRHLLGAAPMAREPAWLWKDGYLNVDYGTVRMDVLAAGRCQTAFIVAVSGDLYAPAFRIGFSDPQPVRPGDVLTIADGTIRLSPDPECAAFG